VFRLGWRISLGMGWGSKGGCVVGFASPFGGHVRAKIHRLWFVHARGVVLQVGFRIDSLFECAWANGQLRQAGQNERMSKGLLYLRLGWASSDRQNVEHMHGLNKDPTRPRVNDWLAPSSDKEQCRSRDLWRAC
jgi:hypothetical protein